MKKAIVSILAVFGLILMGAPLAAQQPAAPANPAPAENPNVVSAPGSNLIQVTLEDFEESEDWVAKATNPVGETKTLKIAQRGEIKAADDTTVSPPEAETVSASDDPANPNHILGVKTNFLDRGYDRVEVMPPHEYSIKGKARQFSVWVLGRKFRHTLSIKLRDYKGKIHKLKMGPLNYFGWRKMVAVVPGWLPQSTRYSLLDKNLHFVSLFVTSDHHEVPGTFYFYMDGLKAMIDKSELDYPGSEIKDNW